MPKTSFEDILKQTTELSDKQYAHCREAGFSEEEIANLNTVWLSEHEEWVFPLDTNSAPMTAKQFKWLLTNDLDFEDVPIHDISFAQARNVIGCLIRQQGDDARYQRAVQARFEAAKARRNGAQ